MGRVLEFGPEPVTGDRRLRRCLPSDTPRLGISRLGREDAADFYHTCDDPLIRATIPFISVDFDLRQSIELLSKINEDTDCFYGVRTGDGQIIGVIGAHLSTDRDVEIGYWFVPACHGQGYALEAVGSVIDSLRAGVPQRRIVAQCRPQNESSWKLLNKLGFDDQGSANAREGRHFRVLKKLPQPARKLE